MWSNFVGTLQALFDVKQAPFRILLKTVPGAEAALSPGDQAVTIAVGHTRREMDEDWAWLEANISQPARESGEISDLRVMTYRVCKIIEEQMAARSGVCDGSGQTDESAVDERFRATARAFRHTFGLPESERLVNCTCTR